MSRNFENWLDAYLNYSEDGFTPKQFNTWCGLSAIAGALERKVWIPWSDTFSYYPNIYVLLVSLPGAGKSTALNKAVGLLTEMRQRNGLLKLIPSQVTEAKFIEIMGTSTSFEIGTKIYNQSSGYYWASEASNSLKNIYGDFIACLTDFYDCPPLWEKATMKGDRLTLHNVTLNLLAGSTLAYLAELINNSNIMGGFASRLIYVIHRDKSVRKQKFQLGGLDPNGKRATYRTKLIQDLQQIHDMKGPFTSTPEFGEAWETWYPQYESRRQEHASEKLQSLLVRTNTNMLKVSMLMSAAESDDRILKLHHWERARTLIEAHEAELPGIFRESKSLDTKSQEGMNAAIFRAFEGQKQLGLSALKAHLHMKNFSPTQVENSINFMKTHGSLKTVGLLNGGDVLVELAVNPDDHM